MSVYSVIMRLWNGKPEKVTVVEPPREIRYATNEQSRAASEWAIKKFSKTFQALADYDREA